TRFFEITDGKITPKFIEDLPERQPFRSQAACKRPFAETKKIGDGFGSHPLIVRQKGRNGALHDRSEGAALGRADSDCVLTDLYHQLLQEWVLPNDRQVEQCSVQTNLVRGCAKLHVAP